MPAALKRIGIGIGDDPDKVLSSVAGIAGKFETFCYCNPGTVTEKPADDTIHIIEHSHPEQVMIDDLISGKIDAAVRGTLPANSTLSALKKAEGVDHLERIAL